MIQPAMANGSGGSVAERASAVASLSVERSVDKERAEAEAAAGAKKEEEEEEEEEDIDDWSDRETVILARVAFVSCGLSVRLGRCCAGKGNARHIVLRTLRQACASVISQALICLSDSRVL